ncbi:hypothetical protein HY732_02235 [Candidatus Uhrbacteria bacterium]|nr:hypothetical protein [Candidatus Uhrbacteria bacterium]
MNMKKVFYCALILSFGGGVLFFSVTQFARGATTAEKLKGRILLQVENKGEAWYLRPDTGTRVYLGRPADAFGMMRSFGLGITNVNLAKIPIGIVTPEMTKYSDASEGVNAGIAEVQPCISDLFAGSAGKGYADCFTKAMSNLLGYDLQKDSDGDGYSDAIEIANNYNPYGPGKMPIDEAFTKKLRGKILLQVEERGEAWYVEPRIGRRYFLGRPSDAFAMMRGFGLGISNDDLEKIKIDNEINESVAYSVFENQKAGIRFQYPQNYPTPIIEQPPQWPRYSGIFGESSATLWSFALGRKTTGGALEGDDDYLSRIYVYPASALTYETVKEKTSIKDELVKAKEVVIEGKKAIVIDECGEYCSAMGFLFSGSRIVLLEMKFKDSSDKTFEKILKTIESF